MTVHSKWKYWAEVAKKIRKQIKERKEQIKDYLKPYNKKAKKYIKKIINLLSKKTILYWDDWINNKKLYTKEKYNVEICDIDFRDRIIYNEYIKVYFPENIKQVNLWNERFIPTFLERSANKYVCMQFNWIHLNKDFKTLYDKFKSLTWDKKQYIYTKTKTKYFNIWWAYSLDQSIKVKNFQNISFILNWEKRKNEDNILSNIEYNFFNYLKNNIYWYKYVLWNDWYMLWNISVKDNINYILELKNDWGNYINLDNN